MFRYFQFICVGYMNRLNEDALVFVCLCGRRNTVPQQCVYAFLQECDIVCSKETNIWCEFSLFEITRKVMNHLCCKDITTGSTHGKHTRSVYKSITEHTLEQTAA